MSNGLIRLLLIFVLEEDKEKELLLIFVNNLVAGLTVTLTDKEIYEIIDFVNDIINKEHDSSKLDIAKMLLDSGVDLSTVKVVFLQLISEAIMIHLKESNIVLVAVIGYIIDFIWI